MEFLGTIVLAALAGLVALRLVPGVRSSTNSLPRAIMSSIVLGLLGAGLSWLLLSLFSGDDADLGNGLTWFLAATAGSVVVLLLGLVIHGKPRARSESRDS